MMKPGQISIPVMLATALLLGACKSKKGLFSEMPSSTTTIEFVNTPEERPFLSILYYLYYYNGGGVAVGDINNDSLPDIYFTANHKGGNKLYLNKGNFRFEDITESAGTKGNADWCSGVTMADVNNDGWLDIYVGTVSRKFGLKGHNELYINNGNSTFTEKSRDYGLDFSGLTTQAAFFDYDRDGDLDCYVLNQSYYPHGNIVDTINRHKYDTISGDLLYRNDLNLGGKFVDVTKEAGIYQSNLGYGLGIAIADMDNDGWDDIYVGNDFHENDYYYLNNGNGTFTESGARFFDHYSRFSMGNDIADYDNDGHLDVITVDMLPPDEKVLKTYGSDENPDIYTVKLERNGYQKQYSRNCLHRNNGNGTSFSETGLLSGISATDWSWAPLFADFDNDGNKDLFISSGIVKRPVDLDYVRFVSDLQVKKGLDMTDKYDELAIEKMPDGSSHPFFFKGSGGLGFREVSDEWGTGKLKGYSNGAAYADLDRDGDLDLVINNLHAKASLLRNDSEPGNSISISFRGDSLNTFGIGAKAYLFTKYGMQYQQLMPTRGFQSAVEPLLHFGLGDTATADSILVVWPGQQYQLLKGVAANQPLVVRKQDASGYFRYDEYFGEEDNALFATRVVDLPWKHRENEFLDYNVQYLIPHGQSDRGPAFAVADVNGDGLDDIYAGGAAGHPGRLWIQHSAGSFAPSDTALFNADAACEDVYAHFFDANGDGFPDLYVANGGNQFKTGSAQLYDRLYINNGRGLFSKSTGLPAIAENKSCVTTADADRDGDIDIFVGVLADAQAYGVPQTSVLLLNDGKGNFSAAGEDIISLEKIGMVTAAVFGDINGDGWSDLQVAGEWMPLTVFINEKGKFKKTELPKSTGMWQTLELADVNGDGHLDMLAGNWGWNNKFWAGKNGPVRMYVNDYDRNGKIEQLVSYTLGGVEYPFLAKDEVERPLPLLKKHYLYYSDYAGVPMKDVFYGWIDTVRPMMAEVLGSAIAYGDGKGGFSLQEMPAPLQLAPVFSFREVKNEAGERMWMAGGNFFNVIPYEGRYDAQPLALFSITDDNEVKYIQQPNLAAIPGQIRFMKWVNMGKNGRVLAVARNNDSLLFLGMQN